MYLLSQAVPTTFSAVNENTLALASLKFDFSLIKVKAPPEFIPVGSALNKSRKTQAEDGAPHRTARRLGALFEQLAPSSPKLISAYGKRASEIINQPAFIPKNLNSYGLFKNFIGVDATGIWAAATSGISAISVYMLACIIAQLLDEKSAISLWTELVSERKKQILRQSAQNGLTSEHTLHSVEQEISRDELALWDAAARSWLRSADEGMYSKKKQLQLIIKSLDIPHHAGADTYTKVIETWQDAMRGVERLLEGKPQEAQDKSVPLALLAWHLYPNLLVLTDATRHVAFEDSLFSPSAMLSLGALTYDSQSAIGSKWSLALSHYQYYGPAVSVQSEEDSFRVTIDQALVVMMGARMAAWDVRARSMEDMREVAAWFKDLFLTLAHPTRSFDTWDTHDEFSWLKPLIKSGLLISDTTSDDKLEDYFRLYRFGQRKYTCFLEPVGNGPPFFGLRNPSILHSMTMPDVDEAQIHYLRRIAREMTSGDTDYVIIKDPDQRCELITARPWPVNGHKRDGDGGLVSVLRHIRWSLAKHSSVAERLSEEYQSRVFALGEVPMDGSSGSRIVANVERHALRHGSSRLREDGSFSVSWRSAGQEPTTFIYSRAAGDTSCGLYVKHDLRLPRELLAECITDIRQQSVSIADSRILLRKCNPSMLARGLHNAAKVESTSNKASNNSIRDEDLSVTSFMTTFIEPFRDNDLNLRSFVAVNIIWSVYRHLPHATISTKVFTSGQILARASWVREAQSAWTEPTRHTHQMSWQRPLALACVIYMDSGGIDVETGYLSEAFAICRENCMYITNAVLSEPLEETPESGLELIRLVGNFGQRGTSVLIGPKNPLIREATSDYRTVNHAAYDGLRENSFEGTSLHLRFTGWKLPIQTSSKAGHTIDHDIHYLESEIKVRDRGQWVADLDILSGIHLHTRQINRGEYCSCPASQQQHSLSQHRDFPSHVISIDNWDELLDPPIGAVVVFRAHGNWSARLAAASILAQRGERDRTLFVGPKKWCLKCIDMKIYTVPHKSEDTVYLID